MQISRGLLKKCENHDVQNTPISELHANIAFVADISV